MSLVQIRPDANDGYALVAQLAEQPSCKGQVVGANPTLGLRGNSSIGRAAVLQTADVGSIPSFSIWKVWALASPLVLKTSEPYGLDGSTPPPSAFYLMTIPNVCRIVANRCAIGRPGKCNTKCPPSHCPSFAAGHSI